MTLEANLWRTLRPKLASFGPVRRIENAAGTGTPDVVYCLRRNPTKPAISGWIELKVLPAIPRDKIHIRHLTIEQVLFAEEWSAAGGLAGLFIKIADHYVALEPLHMRRLAEQRMTMDDLRAVAAICTTKLDIPKIVIWLTREGR